MSEEINIKNLIRFAAVVDNDLNQLNAAKALGISQSLISKGLNSLEWGLGTRLISRNGKHLGGLTPEGREVYIAAKRISAIAMDIKEYKNTGVIGCAAEINEKKNQLISGIKESLICEMNNEDFWAEKSDLGIFGKSADELTSKLTIK